MLANKVDKKKKQQKTNQVIMIPEKENIAYS
jgi:hypothetical protein